MTTVTLTDTRRSPRRIRAAAATIAAAIALTVGYQATASLTRQDGQTQSATYPKGVTPTATPGTDDLTANPFQAMSDLTPVVSAQISAATNTADPFQVMSDLTPVVSAHINTSARTTDPFEGMRDLTPIVAAHTNDTK